MQLLAISNWWFNSVWQWSCCHVCIHWYHRSYSHLQYHLDQMSTYINSKVRKQGTQLLHKNPTRDGMYAILCHCHHSKNKRSLYSMSLSSKLEEDFVNQQYWPPDPTLLPRGVELRYPDWASKSLWLCLVSTCFNMSCTSTTKKNRSIHIKPSPIILQVSFTLMVQCLSSVNPWP